MLSTILLLTLLIEPADAQEVGLIATPQYAMDVLRERDGEHTDEIHTRVRAFASGDTDRDGSWFLEVRGENHVLIGNELGSGEEAWYEVRAGESGWEGELADHARVRVGHLIQRWGKHDLLPVVDVLNARDLRNGPLTPEDWVRLPAPMATLRLGSGWLQSETTFLPFSTADRLWMRETDWSYTRQGMSQQQVEEASGWPGSSSLFLAGILEDSAATLDEMDPTLRRGLDHAVNEKGLPQAFWVNAEIAQRFLFEGPGFDVALMGGYYRSRQPEAQLAPFLSELLQEERLPEIEEFGDLSGATSGGPIDSEWPYTAMGGLDASTVVGPIGLSTEAGYFTARPVRRHWGNAASVPMLGVGAGIDYTRGSWLFVSLEGRWQHLQDPPEDMLFSLEDMVQLGGGVRFTFARDRGQLTVGGVYDLTYTEYLVRPSFTWRLSDPFELELSALFLDGPEPPPITVRGAMTFQGGPASYFAQNDSVAIALSWIL